MLQFVVWQCAIVLKTIIKQVKLITASRISVIIGWLCTAIKLGPASLTGLARDCITCKINPSVNREGHCQESSQWAELVGVLMFSGRCSYSLLFSSCLYIAFHSFIDIANMSSPVSSLVRRHVSCMLHTGAIPRLNPTEYLQYLRSCFLSTENGSDSVWIENYSLHGDISNSTQSHWATKYDDFPTYQNSPGARHERKMTLFLSKISHFCWAALNKKCRVLKHKSGLMVWRFLMVRY